MPKPAVGAHQRASEFKNDGLYASDSLTLMCKYCNCTLSYEKKDTVQKHLKTQKHVSLKEKFLADKEPKLQTSVLASFSSAKRRKVVTEHFALKTTEAFAKANIPLEKLDNEHLREWMAEFTEGAGDLPCVKTLREKYVPQASQAHFDELCKEVLQQNVHILCDETTDRQGRCIFVVLFKIHPDSLIQPILRVAAVNILEKADATTCSQAINDCVRKYNVNFQNIQCLVSDSARYMTKCMSSLQVLFGNHVVHVQCWAHKLALVGNVFCCELRDVNEAVVKVKTAFLNTRKRRHHYAQYLTDHSDKPANQFPMPVNTRWNSWFKAVFYLADYLLDILNFFRQDELKANNNSGINYLTALSDKEVSVILAECVFIKAHTEEIVNLLTKLEGSQYPTAHLLYGDLDHLKKSFQCCAEGIYSYVFETSMESLSTADKAKVKQQCQNASVKAITKLQSLISTDPSRNIFTSINKLFSTKNILLNDTKDVLPLFDSVPTFNGMDHPEVFKGYESLKEAVQQSVEKASEPDLVKVLQALGVEQKEFARAALNAIWMPTNNVDSERLLSRYNIVVTDRRQNLKNENIETFTMLSFDNDS